MPSSITLTVSNLPASTSFFLSALQPLHYIYRGKVNDAVGFGHPNAPPDFWITEEIPGVPAGAAHVAFPAGSQKQVHDFFLFSLKAGGKSHGEPQLRDTFTGYYSAAVIDLDGNSIEAVYRPDIMQNKENVDPAQSVVSTTQKSIATKSKAPTVAPSTTQARSTVSRTPSRAPSAAPSRAPSAAPSRVPSRAPSRVPSQAALSVAPSAAPAATPRTAVTRAPSYTGSQAQPASNASVLFPAQQPDNGFGSFLSEARGTISVAQELVNSARSAGSPPSGSAKASSPDSHGPSDAIVGTLLGVAAGAALHYAFTHRKKDSPPPAPAAPHPGITRSETVPSYTDERYGYYNTEPQLAIEGAPSNFGRPQRLIDMIDNDPAISEYQSTMMRPRRRSSFGGISHAKSQATGTTSRTKTKLLEAPPSSYRNPAVVTSVETTITRRSRPRSSSLSRGASTIVPKMVDDGYASASDMRSKSSSQRSSRSKHISHSETPSRASSRHHSSGHNGSHTPSRKGSAVTTIRSPDQYALPPSRAATEHGDGDSFFSTHSRPNKTIIGRLTERQLNKLDQGGRLANSDVTKSVIGKIKDVDRMNVSDRELRPNDSVSQVSSNRGSRRR